MSDGEGTTNIEDEIITALLGSIETLCIFFGSKPSKKAIFSLYASIVMGLLVYSLKGVPNSLVDFLFSEYLLPLLLFVRFFGSVLTSNKHILFNLKSKSAQLRAEVEAGKISRLTEQVGNTKINLEDLKSIFVNLERGGIPPELQIEILRNKSIYSNIDATEFIKKRLLEKDYWTPSAVIIFLRSNKKKLLQETLKEIYLKYNHFESVRFEIGRFFDFTKIDDLKEDEYIKAGLKYQTNYYNIFLGIKWTVLSILLIIIVYWLAVILEFVPRLEITINLVLGLVSFAISVFSTRVIQYGFEYSLKKFVKDEKLDLAEEVKLRGFIDHLGPP